MATAKIHDFVAVNGFGCDGCTIFSRRRDGSEGIGKVAHQLVRAACQGCCDAIGALTVPETAGAEATLGTPNLVVISAKINPPIGIPSPERF